MTKRQYCLANPEIAVFSESAFGGVAIHGIEYGITDYVFVEFFSGERSSYHRLKIRYGTHGMTFKVYGRTYHINEFVRVI